MNLYTQFTFLHFLILSIILLIFNLFLIKYKNQNFKSLLNWKVFIIALIITFLGLFYYEMRYSGDWLLKSFGFPRDFYVQKFSTNNNSFVRFDVIRFDYINFFQNLILYYLISNLIYKLLKQ